jgi:hypothetical protein
MCREKNGPDVDRECFYDIFQYNTPGKSIGIIHNFVNLGNGMLKLFIGNLQEKVGMCTIENTEILTFPLNSIGYSVLNRVMPSPKE